MQWIGVFPVTPERCQVLFLKNKFLSKQHNISNLLQENSLMSDRKVRLDPSHGGREAAPGLWHMQHSAQEHMSTSLLAEGHHLWGKFLGLEAGLKRVLCHIPAFSVLLLALHLFALNGKYPGCTCCRRERGSGKGQCLHGHWKWEAWRMRLVEPTSLHQGCEGMSEFCLRKVCSLILCTGAVTVPYAFQWQLVGLPKISAAGIPLEIQGIPCVLHSVVPAHQVSLTEALETRKLFKIGPPLNRKEVITWIRRTCHYQSKWFEEHTIDI